ncbi:hypothetical protein L873DRAFT_1058592 [Choiromyces venosus 120613-1]|uniref:Uncharacterized protein n=1 Tax=Choiromyces venosus 120613-1 TaxID=1336337 RepID=A0A3N4JWU7_9PEZI|nr:hypothetical protein L873DRAFT_1058592 [Choiromyces venosus 120613-1]
MLNTGTGTRGELLYHTLYYCTESHCSLAYLPVVAGAGGFLGVISSDLRADTTTMETTVVPGHLQAQHPLKSIIITYDQLQSSTKNPMQPFPPHNTSQSNAAAPPFLPSTFSIADLFSHQRTPQDRKPAKTPVTFLVQSRASEI